MSEVEQTNRKGFIATVAMFFLLSLTPVAGILVWSFTSVFSQYMAYVMTVSASLTGSGAATYQVEFPIIPEFVWVYLFVVTVVHSVWVIHYWVGGRDE